MLALVKGHAEKGRSEAQLDFGSKVERTGGERVPLNLEHLRGTYFPLRTERIKDES